MDVVLTDLQMPEVSGWEVVKATKDRWPHLRVGVITGTPEAFLQQRGEPLDCVIFKPFTLDALQETLSRLRPSERGSPRIGCSRR